jgi:hypothetical protein
MPGTDAQRSASHAGLDSTSAFTRLNNRLDAHAYLFVIAFLLACFAGSAVKARRLPMWLDEAYTLNMVYQPSAAAVIDAVRDGADAAPPLYALIVRAVRPALGSDHLALRLPSTLGFYVMCLCVYAFVSRRLPPVYGAMAMLIAAVSSRYYATEGRPYGLVLGAVGIALISWQRAAERRPRLLALLALSFSLAFSIALHVYAIFTLIAFGAGEIVLWLRTRKLDRTMALAITLPIISVFLYIPLLPAARRFTVHFHTGTSMAAIPESYIDWFGPLLPGFIAAALLYAVWQFATDSGRLTSSAAAGRFAMKSHEITACAVLAFLPVLADLTCLLSTVGVFIPRYVIPAIIGVAILLSVLLFTATRASTAAAASVVICFGGSMAVYVLRPVLRTPERGQASAIIKNLAKLPPEPRSIAFGDHRTMLELWFYLEPSLRDRVLYPIDETRYLAYKGNDSAPLLLSALRRYMPTMHLPNWGDFVSLNPRFFLVSDGDDWVTWNLLKSGFRITPYTGAPPKTAGNPGIYLVEAAPPISKPDGNTGPHGE